MKVAISFLCTEFQTLREHWKVHNKSKTHAGTDVGLGGARPNEKGIEPFIGGKVILIDWPKMDIIWEMDLDGAAGFIIEKNRLTIANMRLNYLSTIDMKNKIEIKKICHPFFNCLHSLNSTPSGYLVSSSGTDLILEINEKGETLFEWWATDHGYNISPKGDKRILPKNLPHNEYIYPTLHQTTHVNSALQINDNILATLFHQGTLIKINKKTLVAEVLLSGLSCPHGVKKYGDKNWTISDTKNNQVLILNSNFEIQDELSKDFSWVQDHCATKNNSLLIADANNNRVVEMNPQSKSIINEFNYSKDWRIYQVYLV